MIPASGTHVASPLRIFITDDGAHSPEDWAIVTARMLVSTGQNISPAKLEAARALRTKMVLTLTESFRSVSVASSSEQIASTARAAAQRFIANAKGSPWETEFGHEDIAAAMEDVVRRNLATHADILLKTE